jgi:hypothetical protein
MKKIRILALLALPLALFAQNDAQTIIDRCIEAHGGKNYKNLAVSLDFRQFHLILKQKEGAFWYERSTTDSAGTVWRDVLNNDGFYREQNGAKVELSEKHYARYREGINSQAYFLLLPYKLKDEAVVLSYLGEGVVEGKKQHKIKVSFRREGGGEDHEDVFCYWINKKTHRIDYIAYSSGGPRFRKATTRHKADGVLFQDYENYEIKDKTIPTHEYDRLFAEGKARLLSKIEHRNVRKVDP